MISSIIFIISYIFIIYAFLRFEKTNKKLNVLLWLFISFIMYMAYNSIIIYLLSVINIHSTLLLRSIINVIISILMLLLSKGKQKYYIDKMDISIIIILFYLAFLIFLFRFGFNFNVEFEIDDAAVHFAYGKAFMLSNILNGSMFNIAYNLPENSMFFSSTNLGTFMELLKPITGNFDMYKSFIIFEMLSFFLSGVLLYFIIRRDNISNKNYLLVVVLLVLYQLGYPLTNLLCGFHYWGLIILVISTIILIIKEFTVNDMYDSKMMVIILFIMSIAVFITYYLYVPVVYGSLGLYFIYLWKFKKKINFKRLSIYTIIILIIPFIFGLCYNNIIGEYFSQSLSDSSMNIDGPNYKNLIGNFIFLLPLIIYNLINNIKQNKINLITILAILNFLYMVILFILCIKGSMSSYYYGKIYNLSWLIFYIYLIEIILYNNNQIIRLYIYSYIIIVLLAIVRIENIINKYSTVSNDTVISNLGNIYDYNMEFLSDKEKIIDKDIYDLLKHVYNNQDEYKNIRGEIPFVASYFEKRWIAQILDIIPNNNDNTHSTELFKINKFAVLDTENIINDTTTAYFVWIVSKKNKDDIVIDNYDIMYENRAGYVLKKRF